MKRYRVASFDIDSRAYFLTIEINDAWDENIKAGHQKNKEKIEQELIALYGSDRAEVKRQNLIDLESKPVSIIAFHNKFAEQIRTAFIMEAYYPALTSACALGERILNHLILKLRDDFKATPEYKQVYDKSSFDDWDRAVDILDAWGVLLPDAAKAFKALADLRNRRAIHFNPEADTNDRELALEAIHLISSIISQQFSAFGPQPWFITNIPGEIYLKAAAQSEPFIKKVYIPNAVLVGPDHWLEEFTAGMFVVHDRDDYPVDDISDEDFVQLRTASRQSR